jgi:hypothetical protein
MRDRHPVTLILDGVRQNYNIGAIFRLCDGFLVERLMICDTPLSLHKRKLVQAGTAELRCRCVRGFWNTLALAPRASHMIPQTKHTGGGIFSGCSRITAVCGPVTAGRDAVVLAEGLGKRCGRLVPDSSGNSIDGIVAGFKHEGGFIHSTRDHVSMHRLANEPRKPR